MNNLSVTVLQGVGFAQDTYRSVFVFLPIAVSRPRPVPLRPFTGAVPLPSSRAAAVPHAAEERAALAVTAGEI